MANSALSSSQGYICYGNWKELCSLGDTEDVLPKNSTRGKGANKRKRNGDLTVDGPLSTGMYYNSTLPFANSTAAAPSTTLLPSLSSSFPLPIPSQTDCNFSYEW